jgi:hypothetical protein
MGALHWIFLFVVGMGALLFAYATADEHIHTRRREHGAGTGGEWAWTTAFALEEELTPAWKHESPRAGLYRCVVALGDAPVPADPDEEPSFVCEAGAAAWANVECWTSQCAARAHGGALVAELSRRLEQLVGQHAAVEQLKRAVYHHSWRRPLVLHLAGDNGVGKTTAAKLVAQARLSRRDPVDPDQPDGLLILDGEAFSGDEGNAGEGGGADGDPLWSLSAARARLLDVVLSHIARCPYAVVVLDEVQKADPRVVSVLGPAFEQPSVARMVTENEATRAVYVRTAEALFVLTSDFGAEGIVAAQPADSVEMYIRERLRVYWHERVKLSSLMTHVVPFLPMTEDALAEIAARRLDAVVRSGEMRNEDRIRRLCYDPRVPRVLAAHALALYPAENVRGLGYILNTAVWMPISGALLDQYAGVPLDAADEKPLPPPRSVYIGIRGDVRGDAATVPLSSILVLLTEDEPTFGR